MWQHAKSAVQSCPPKERLACCWQVNPLAFTEDRSAPPPLPPLSLLVHTCPLPSILCHSLSLSLSLSLLPPSLPPSLSTSCTHVLSLFIFSVSRYPSLTHALPPPPLSLSLFSLTHATPPPPPPHPSLLNKRKQTQEERAAENRQQC